MSSSVNVKSLYKQRAKNLTGLIFDLFVYLLPNKNTSYSGYTALNGYHSELGCKSALYLEGLWSKSWLTVHILRDFMLLLSPSTHNSNLSMIAFCHIPSNSRLTNHTTT